MDESVNNTEENKAVKNILTSTLSYIKLKNIQH